jgi:hypothetical protein
MGESVRLGSLRSRRHRVSDALQLGKARAAVEGSTGGEKSRALQGQRLSRKGRTYHCRPSRRATADRSQRGEAARSVACLAKQKDAPGELTAQTAVKQQSRRDASGFALSPPTDAGGFRLFMASSEGGRTGGRSHSDELSHDAQVRQRKLSTGSVTDNAAYWQMLQTAKPPGRSFALAVGAYSALPSRPKKAQRRCGGFLPLRAQQACSKTRHGGLQRTWRSCRCCWSSARGTGPTSAREHWRLTQHSVADVTLISNRTGTRPQRLLNH